MKLLRILICWIRVRILFYEQAKSVESVATSLKYAFSSLREHLHFNFNSDVFIDQMIWSVLSMVHFVLNPGPFCLKTWSVLSLT